MCDSLLYSEYKKGTQKKNHTLKRLHALHSLCAPFPLGFCQIIYLPVHFTITHVTHVYYQHYNRHQSSGSNSFDSLSHSVMRNITNTNHEKWRKKQIRILFYRFYDWVSSIFFALFLLCLSLSRPLCPARWNCVKFTDIIGLCIHEIESFCLIRFRVQSQMTRWYFINSFHYVARIVEWAHLPTITGKDWLGIEIGMGHCSRSGGLCVYHFVRTTSYCTCNFHNKPFSCCCCCRF